MQSNPGSSMDGVGQGDGNPDRRLSIIESAASLEDPTRGLTRQRHSTAMSNLAYDLAHRGWRARIFWDQSPVAHDDDQPEEIPWLIHHESAFHHIWDGGTIVLLIWLIITLPLELAFDVGSFFQDLMNYIQTGWFILDVVLNFFTTLAAPEGDIIIDRTKICQSYLQGWFVIDIVSSVPIGLIRYGPDYRTEADSSSGLAAIKVVKMTKLLRLFRLGRIASKLQAKYEISYSTIYIVQFCIVLLIGAHWLGCLFWMVAEKTESEGYTSWIDGGDPPFRERRVWGQYVACLYWALTTMTTIGYGDITPQDPYEQLFGMCAMVIGAIAFAYGLTNIVTLIYNKNAMRAEFETEIDNLSDFMSRNNVPQSTRKRVHRYMFFRQYRSEVELRAAHYEDSIEGLSPKLKRDLLADVLQNLIPRNNPVFKGVIFVRLGHRTGRRLARALAAGVAGGNKDAMQLTAYGADELVHEQSATDPGDKVSVLGHGTVNFIGGTINDHSAGAYDQRLGCATLLHRGSTWGEMGCFLTEGGVKALGVGHGHAASPNAVAAVGTFSVRTLQHSDVFVFSGAALRSALVDVLQADRIAQLLQELRARLCDGSADHWRSDDPEAALPSLGVANADTCDCGSASDKDDSMRTGLLPDMQRANKMAPDNASPTADAPASNRTAAPQQGDDGSDSGLGRLLHEQHRLIEQQTAHIAQLRSKLGWQPRATGK